MIDFDPATIPLGYTYDAAGRVLTRQDSYGQRRDYTYDADGITIIKSHNHEERTQ